MHFYFFYFCCENCGGKLITKPVTSANTKTAFGVTRAIVGGEDHT